MIVQKNEEQKRKDMKKNLTYIGLGISAVVGFIVIAMVIIMSMRKFSEMTVAKSLFSPRPGVECMQWVTADGVTAQCWKDADLPKFPIRPEWTKQ